jgi:hypothetical protein
MATHETTIPFPLAQGGADTTTYLLNPEDIAREACIVGLECRQALLTSLLPADDLTGRFRSSIVIARARRDGEQ